MTFPPQPSATVPPHEVSHAVTLSIGTHAGGRPQTPSVHTLPLEHVPQFRWFPQSSYVAQFAFIDAHVLVGAQTGQAGQVTVPPQKSGNVCPHVPCSLHCVWEETQTGMTNWVGFASQPAAPGPTWLAQTDCDGNAVASQVHPRNVAVVPVGPGMAIPAEETESI